MPNIVTVLNRRLKVMQRMGKNAAPKSAAQAMGLLGVAAIKVELNKSSHAVGEPAGPPGEPPSHVTGKLSDSAFSTNPSRRGGNYTVMVSMLSPYARIQELGGTIVPKRARSLHWVDASGEHFAQRVTLPARPYFVPAIGALAASGELTEVAARTWLAAMEI